MTGPKRVLAAVHDPGGCSGLLPVLAAMAKSADLSLFAGKFVEARVKTAGLTYEPLPSDLSMDQARRMVEQASPNALLTGTSWGSQAEQNLRNAAREQGIRSVVFLDYWSNYAKRWEGADYPISESTDVVAAVDSPMRDEMLAEGFPRDRVVVTGHPRLEALSSEAAGRRGHNGKALFLSEPARSSYQGSFSEHPILKLAEALAGGPGRKTELEVKLHPKEELTPELERVIGAAGAIGTPTRLVTTVALPQAFTDYEYVFGYQSMGLFEAAAMGCKALAFPSSAPGKGLSLAMLQFGIEQLTADVAGIRRALERADRAPPKANGNGGMMVGATEAIRKLVLGG